MDGSGRRDLVLRASALVVLGAVAFGLLVWYGSASGTLASLAAVAPLAGAPIRATADLAWTAGADPGTLVAAPVRLSLEASERSALASRARWEEYYMYGVSALAATWLWARLALDWRFEPRSLRLVPRSGEGERDA